MNRILNGVLVVCGLLAAVAIFMWVDLMLKDPAKAAELPTYCESREAIAKALILASKDGTPVANVNVYWDPAPDTATQWAERENWVRELKTEVGGYLQDNIPREDIAHKVRAKCDRDGGKQVRSLRDRSRDLVRTGSIPPIAENDAATLIMGASNQNIADPTAPRKEQCRRKLMDETHARNGILDKVTPDELRMSALRAADKLGLERFDRVMKIIDEVEKAQKEDRLQAWYDEYWHACVDGAN